jgi:CRISPR-associated protein Cst2
MGSTDVRRAVLEMTRAVSLTPWAGEHIFNAASPGATPCASKGGGSNPVPYAAEIHATRYQYGLAMIPGRLRDPKRVAVALRALGRLGPVAGNHGRFLFDFAPESIVIRLPTTRRRCCSTRSARPAAEHAAAKELLPGANRFPGIKTAVEAACGRIDAHAGVTGAKA